MLTAYYDLALSPPTYEILSFLMRVERERIARGERKVEVVFLPGPAGGFRQDRLWPHDVGQRQAMLRDVCIPICRLLPSLAGVRVEERRPSIGFGVGSALYGFPVYVNAYRDGIRPLRSPPVEQDPDLITMTLREADHWPERNSNHLQWLDAAARLHQRGFRVVFVRDTKVADRAIPAFQTDPAAARDITARAALYSRAALNLFVSNGPAWLSMAMDLPTAIFRPVHDSLGRAFSRQHLDRCGVVAGGQLPNAPAYQRLVWEQDGAEAIVAAVEQQVSARTEAA